MIVYSLSVRSSKGTLLVRLLQQLQLRAQKLKTDSCCLLLSIVDVTSCRCCDVVTKKEGEDFFFFWHVFPLLEHARICTTSS